MARVAAAFAAATLAALGAGASPACACSCAKLDPERALKEFDAAFVGRFLQKKVGGPIRSSADPATYVFQVEGVLKGALPKVVAVESAVEGASCGLEPELFGDRVGVFLQRDGDKWTSGLCAQVAASELASFETSEPEDWTDYGPLTERDDDRRDVVLAGAGAFAFVLLALAGIAAYRRRRLRR